MLLLNDGNYIAHQAWVMALRYAALLIAYLCITSISGHAAGISGLDGRPTNQTCVAPQRPQNSINVEIEMAFPGLILEKPMAMVQPPGDGTVWYAAEREGRIVVFNNVDTTSTKTTVLDISDRFIYTDTSSVGASSDSQQWGITGLALHPDFPAEPYLFVAYNAKPEPDGPVFSFVSRFARMEGSQSFDADSELNLILVEQSTIDHHVGHIVIGPDEYLYIGLGEGRCNPPDFLCAQDVNDLKGSVLRLDVRNDVPYGIPPDNPFAQGGGRGEIFAYGLRNPWRFSFDRVTGELLLGDVGDTTWEEISLIESGGNYGWPVMEGNECREAGCNDAGLIPPVFQLGHDTLRAIIGGFVYRGANIPQLEGTYLFADFLGGTIWGLQYDEQGSPFEQVIVESALGGVTSFAESLDGEVYVIWVRDNRLYRLVPGDDTGGTPSTFPALLSETGCADPIDPARVPAGLIDYDVNTILWSDGADKRRWLAIPDGNYIQIESDGDFTFPIGSVLRKDFLIEEQLVETRLFMRHSDGGWAGYSYEWNDARTDAALLPAGKSKLLANGQTWRFPSRQQCLSCHTEVAGFTLGPEVAQFNRLHTYTATGRKANQLNTLDQIGLLSAPLQNPPELLPALAPADDVFRTIGRRARSYLHANCSGCHRADGPTQANIDLRSQLAVTDMNICNVPPNEGDLGIPGVKLLDPGIPLNSVISLRMHDLGINRMPPLGTTIEDPLGTAVVDQWIASPFVCQTESDSDGDNVADRDDNCPDQLNPDQADSDSDGAGDVCDPDVNPANVSLMGKPYYELGVSEGIYLWKDSFDGPYELRVVGGPPRVEFDLDLIASGPLLSAEGYSIEGHDQLEIGENGFSLNAIVFGWDDGVRFRLAPNTRALISVVKQENTPNPVPVWVGEQMSALPDAGWIKNLSAFPLIPALNRLGLAAGRIEGNNALSFRWTGGNALHTAEVDVLTAGLPGTIVPVSLEPPDVLEQSSHAVRVLSKVLGGFDGLDLWPGTALDIGLAYRQDLRSGLPYVNRDGDSLGPPNAHWVPQATPYGAPAYDPATEAGLYLWQDQASGVWHLRATAAVGFKRYTGEIVSDQPFSNVSPYLLEASDILDTTVPTRIVFDLGMWDQWQDGFDFEFPANAIVYLNLQPQGAGEDPAEAVRIGAARWPVEQLPVDLSGW